MQLTHQGTMMTSGNEDIRGVTAMEVMHIGGEIMLYAHSVGAGGTLSGLQVFSDAGGGFVSEGAASGSYNWAAAQGVNPGMVSVTIDGVEQILMSGAAGGDIAGHDVLGTGGLGTASTLDLTLGPAGAIDAMIAVNINGQDFVFASHDGSDGIYAYEQIAAGSYSQVYQSDASAQGHAFQSAMEGDITGVSVVNAGSTSYLTTASRSDNSVTVWSIDPSGSLTPVSQIGADMGLGLHEPVAMVPVELGGESYVIVAGAGSSSLSVLEIGADGVLEATDHVIDGLSTRFQNVTQLEVATVGDQVFVFVAGADDGVSVFSVLPGGRLLHRATIADEAGTSLDAVSALVASEAGGTITLFVSSGTESGISRFELTPDAAGGVQNGTDGNDTLTGGADGEILAGGAGHDLLSGEDGDDILQDGAGQDQMRGGDGADVFVFEADGEVDHVLDYNWQEDRLDMSGLGMIYDMSQIEIIPTAIGATLIFGSERIEVISHDGQSLTAANFSNGTLLDVQHSPISNVWANQNLVGTAGDDVLIGGEGNDFFDGGAGADSFEGLGGIDTVSYASATTAIVVDLNRPDRNIGDAAGDSFVGIEVIEGSDLVDRMFGSGEDDILIGGKKADTLIGRRGDDVLDGGIGGDRIFGDEGADLLTGGDDVHRDLFAYNGISDSLPGVGNRDIITDFEAGEDQIDLRRIDTDADQGGNQSFTFVGAGAFTQTAGELRFEVGQDITLVQADLDGDGVADFEIELRGEMTLAQEDFLL